MTNEFVAFPKIPRLFREIVVTEKIDGTNACVVVSDDGNTVTAQSRTRVITPQDDNFGFAAWVEENKEELKKLGPGHHFGEWWGRGIQRGYGLDHRRFSLFNTHRWTTQSTPACCHVVPVVYTGIMATDALRHVLELLKESGSYAAPGFDKPEGIMIYHTAAGQYFKYTLDGDGHKG